MLFSGSSQAVRFSRTGTWPFTDFNRNRGTFAAWVRNDGGTGTRTVFSAGIDNTTNYIKLEIVGTNYRFTHLNTAGSTIVQLDTSVGYATDTDSFHHIVGSYDVTAGTSGLYVDDVSDKTQTTLTNGTLFSGLDRVDIARSVASTNYWNGVIAEITYFAGVYIDLSTESNRRDFISSDGKPVSHSNLVVAVGQPLLHFTDFFAKNHGRIDFDTRSLEGSPSTNFGVLTYRSGTLYPTPGERWFESDRSGFSYPRSKMIRDSDTGERVGLDEYDLRARRQGRNYQGFSRFIFQEEDKDDIK